MLLGGFLLFIIEALSLAVFIDAILASEEAEELGFKYGNPYSNGNPDSWDDQHGGVS